MKKATEQLGSWFLGEFEYTVDKQRRVAIPSNWRQAGEDENHFFLLPGRDQSLQLVPADTFLELLNRLRKVSFADSQASMALATVGSMAQECRCDKQGRISMSQRLMEHAAIENKALLVGAVATAQIWNPEVWQNKQIDSETGLDVIQKIQEKGDDLGDALRNVLK
ncbi:MAG: hypothetical protein R6V56_01420 [Lentisphaeria bacterium]